MNIFDKHPINDGFSNFELTARALGLRIISNFDDWLFPECIMRMVELAEGNPTVGIVGAYRLDDVHVTCDGLPYPSTVISGRDICRLQLQGGLYVFGSPTSLLIRSDIIRNRDPFYNENSSILADTEACYEILQNCDFGFVHQVLTFTRRENVSISSLVRNFNPDILDKLIQAKKYGQIYLEEEEYKQLLKSVEERYFRFLGESVFENRSSKFWQYHKEGLRYVGYGRVWQKVLKYAVLTFLDFALNLKRVAKRVFRLFVRSR